MLQALRWTGLESTITPSISRMIANPAHNLGRILSYASCWLFMGFSFQPVQVIGCSIDNRQGDNLRHFVGMQPFQLSSQAVKSSAGCLDDQQPLGGVFN